MAGTISQQQHDDQGVTLWLERPGQGNALSQAMILAMIEWLDRAAANPPRYLILAGRGKHFCAGADLDEMRHSGSLTPEQNQQAALTLAGLFDRLDRLPCPTLARIQGAAFGGALGLISACDLAIAADNAQMKLSEVRLGLIPAVISPYVMRAIGERAMRRYTLTGETIDAQRAQQLGLVHRISSLQTLDEAVGHVIRELLLGAPRAQRQAKQLLADIKHRPPAELPHLTAQRIAQCRAGDEARAGIDAFFKRRPPAWISDES